MSVQCAVTARAQVLGLSEASWRNSTVITMVPLQLQAQHSIQRICQSMILPKILTDISFPKNIWCFSVKATDRLMHNLLLFQNQRCLRETMKAIVAGKVKPEARFVLNFCRAVAETKVKDPDHQSTGSRCYYLRNRAFRVAKSIFEWAFFADTWTDDPKSGVCSICENHVILFWLCEWSSSSDLISL